MAYHRGARWGIQARYESRRSPALGPNGDEAHVTDRRAKPAPTPSTRPRSDRSRGAVVRAGSSLIAVAALLAALVAQNGQRATDVRGLPGTAWLSGEIRGRAVLATAGGDAASVAVNVADAGARLDVVDLGRTVLVGNEAANTVSQLSAADGTELRTFDAVSDDGATLALVRAGEVAYLVDAGAGNVRRIDSEGPATAPRDLGTFDQWVGTANAIGLARTVHFRGIAAILA